MAVSWPYFLYGSGTAFTIADLRDPWVVDQGQFIDLGLPVTGIQVSGSNAYAITAAGLHILEYENVGAPSVVGFVPVEDEALSVAVNGWWAFVLGRNGYGVFNISDPASPRMMSWSSSQNAPNEALTFEFPFAYIVGQITNIIDVSNPAIPVLVGYKLINGNGIATAGNFVYVASSYKLSILDIQDPSVPILRSSVSVRGRSSDVVVSLPFVLVSHSSGLDIFDVSDPDDPQSVGTWGGYRENTKALVLDDELIHLAGEEALYILDVSNPPSPIELEKRRLTFARHIAMSDGQALIGDYWTPDVDLVDLTAPAAPIAVGSWRPTPAYNVRAVAFANGNAVVRIDGGLYVLDLADPSAPKQLSFLALFGVGSMVADGNYVYTSSVGAGGFCYFEVVQLTNPSKPWNLGGFVDGRFCESAADIAASEGRVLTADPDGLRIIDATDPRNPFETARWDRSGANGVALVGDIGLVTFAPYDDSFETGLAVIDVSDLTSPVVLSVWNSPGIAKSVTAIGGTALVTTSDAGTFLIDLSDPSHPEVIGEVSHPLLEGFEVASFGQRAIVTHRESGMTILEFNGNCLPPRRPQGRTGVRRIFETSLSP